MPSAGDHVQRTPQRPTPEGAREGRPFVVVPVGPQRPRNADEQRAANGPADAEPRTARRWNGDAAADFVRFCYHRRRVTWPELYDEMCAVASRGTFRGWGYGELADEGISFTVPELPRLAALAQKVADEDRRRAGPAPIAGSASPEEG